MVAEAEQTSSPATDDEMLAMLTAFNMAVGKVAHTVRRLLPQHGGYECKEPEPGKFTLAFRWAAWEPAVHACTKAAFVLAGTCSKRSVLPAAVHTRGVLQCMDPLQLAACCAAQPCVPGELSMCACALRLASGSCCYAGP